MAKIGYTGFLDLIGEDKIPSKHLIKMLKNTNLEYSDIKKCDYDGLYIKILSRLHFEQLSATGDINKWKQGWNDVLVKYKKSKDIDDLTAKFVSRENICRLNDKYIIPKSNTFEDDLSELIHLTLFDIYFKDVDSIFDIGCGTGKKLYLTSKLYPNKKLYGLDWTDSVVELMDCIRTYENIDIHGNVFDMFNPDYSINITETSGIYTSASLEQVGYDFRKFVDFILTKNPKIVINIEPIVEFYEIKNNGLFNYISYLYDIKRNYLNGYYSYLQYLEKIGKIKILKSHKTKFGNFYHDSYSIVIWHPIKNN